MSRDLPPNPNLEHLKKQAKALLETLRQQNAAATLVDAQHALAREYGFPSWPKLKAHVEAAAAAPAAEAPKPRSFDPFTMASAHLEHLKKQAKALLETLRQQNPDATLVDAQHALAREYGLPSWPKLKAHIEAAAAVVAAAPAAEATKPKGLFGRFTMATRQALFFSRYEASQLGRLGIRPEHVLLGIIRGDGRSSRDLWKTTGVTLDEARTAVVVPDEPREVIVEPVQIPFQDATKAVFTAAAEEADRLGHAKISTVHVVAALMREEGAASSFLRSRGITIETARVAAALAESPLAGEDQ